MRRPTAVAAACAALLVLASCGGSPEPSTSSSAPGGRASTQPTTTATQAATATAVEPGKAPTLAIRSPKAGTTVPGDSVTVTLSVDNFDIVSDIGGKNESGEGHVHFYLDVEEIPTTPGEEAVVTGEGRYVATSSTSHTWNDLVPGQHLVGAQLVNNNHTPLQPPVTTQITVTIGA